MNKPTVKLVGQDGNVFNIIGLVSKALIKAHQQDKEKEFTNRVFNATSYDKVLQLAMEYCEVE